jgi:uncharacterized protein YcnI
MVTAMKRIGFIALSLISAAATGAEAHVTLEQSEAKIGSFYKAVLRVTHGCKGSPTIKVEVELPEGAVAVKPMPKPGWTIDIAKGTYGKAYAFHGHDVKEGATTITWSGGSLPDDYYDEFVFSAYLARELKPGVTLYFPVKQTCVEGETDWTEMPAGKETEPEWPAPALKLLAPDKGHRH